MHTFKFGQWTMEVDEEVGHYEMYNLDPATGEKRFFRVVKGAYDAPKFEPESALAFACPNNLTYVNKQGETVATPAEKISGLICQNGPRASLSNLKSKGIAVSANEDGSIQIGEEAWWLATLFSKDKNRFKNYDVFLVKAKPERPVKVLELGDLDLFG